MYATYINTGNNVYLVVLFFYSTSIKFDIISETCFIHFLLKFAILVRNERLSGIPKEFFIYKTNI